jgi:hypothetical protein
VTQSRYPSLLALPAVYLVVPMTFEDFYPALAVARARVARHNSDPAFPSEDDMLIHATKPLFPWDELDVWPTPATIKDARAAIPDAQLLASLNERRHKGCDTYPVSVLWGVRLLSILLRHTTTEAGLEELRSVDATHEVVLSYHVTDTKTGDNECIPARVEQAQGNLPGERIQTLADDKAADDTKVHESVHDAGIKPLIRNRARWPKDGEPEEVVGGRVPLHVVPDEAGTVYCDDTVSEVPVRRAMSYAGHEKSRGTLTYRCPAVVEGFRGARARKCNAGKSYGMTVRVPQEIDRRRVPSIPRAAPPFERLYKGRTSVARVNDRRKVWWGLDDGNVVGSRRFCAHVVSVRIVHPAFAARLAKAQRQEGSFGTMMLSPIAKKLQALMGEKGTRPA